MNKFLYQPSSYTTSRPCYPEELFKFLSQLQSTSLVLECAAGSGQATRGLANVFPSVIATDLSFDLLANAPALSNVLYVQSKAEQLPLLDHSVDLVCVAQALHWFSLPNFYQETNRVIKPGGMLAAWSYNQAKINSEIDKVVSKVYSIVSNPHSASLELRYVYDQYETIPFPFKKLAVPHHFDMRVTWNAWQWLDYMRTWPSILNYQKNNNIDLVASIESELSAAWQDPEQPREVKWPLYLLVGQIN